MTRNAKPRPATRLPSRGSNRSSTICKCRRLPATETAASCAATTGRGSQAFAGPTPKPRRHEPRMRNTPSPPETPRPPPAPVAAMAPRLRRLPRRLRLRRLRLHPRRLRFLRGQLWRCGWSMPLIPKPASRARLSMPRWTRLWRSTAISPFPPDMTLRAIS